MSFCDYIFDTHNVLYSDWVSDYMEWNISSVYEDKEILSDNDFFTTYLEYTADVYGFDVTDFVTWSLKSFASAYDSDFSSFVKNELGYNIKSDGYIALYYDAVNDDTTDVLINFTEKFVKDIVVDTYQTTVLTPTPIPTPVSTVSPTIYPSAVPTVIPSAIPDGSENVVVTSPAVSPDTLVAIQETNFLLTVILFCLIFFWLEKKIKNIIKRFTQTESGCK